MSFNLILSVLYYMIYLTFVEVPKICSVVEQYFGNCYIFQTFTSVRTVLYGDGLTMVKVGSSSNDRSFCKIYNRVHGTGKMFFN